MDAEPEPMLTLDEAYGAAFHFVHQYYAREPISPFLLMLHSMTGWPGSDDPRETADPATWDDWMKSVQKARNPTELEIAVDPGD